MAFLTPLYLLAGLAIGLPVLFHLIRQTPKGRQVFSSLMFLEPSPPKITKRSRVEDWLLLILRATAICLLAIAFARPFFRSQAEAANDQDEGHRITILLDQSASMQRGDLWETAIEQLSNVIDQVDLADAVSVQTFSDGINPVITHEDWLNLPPSSRKPFLLESLEKIKSNDSGTSLGSAMISAANQLQGVEDQRARQQRLIVISDFQYGSQWEELNGFAWPDNVAVWLYPVQSAHPTNATAHFVKSGATTENHVRIRVTNSTESTKEQFQVVWADEFVDKTKTTGLVADGIEVYVPPGQSRIIQVPYDVDEKQHDKLILTGDSHEFDNVSFFANRPPWNAKIVFIGEEQATGPDSLRFFLEPVFPSTSSRTVKIIDWNQELIESPADVDAISLAIIGTEMNEEQVVWCRNYLENGGRAIFVARDPNQAEQLYHLVESDSVPVQEAKIIDYEMLQGVDLTHPVFAPFDDPRFADFSKLRFWKHREFDLGQLPAPKVLASFESDAPAIFEVDHGKGKLIVFAAGWNRSDSDLAVWSKFVPMMNGFLDYLGQRTEYRPLHFVGDELELDQFLYENPKIAIRTPAGEILEVGRDEKIQLAAKGIYTLAASTEGFAETGAIRIAVNIPPDESKIAPIPKELLLAAGVPIEESSLVELAETVDANGTRQMMNQELESQQNLWKWILLAAILILFVETGLAGVRQRGAKFSTPSA